MDREQFDHYLHDEARHGPAADGAFTGAAGGAGCGDLSRISLTVEDGRIAAVSFDAEGCGSTRAATAAVAELVEGETIFTAASLSTDDVDTTLGGLTLAKRHAAVLAADALHRALQGVASSSLNLTPGRGAMATTPAGGRHFPPTPDSVPPPRVAVAMSGGVDSAVAALLERERGAEVIGVTVKLWADPETDGAKACCSPEAVLGARALAHSLGIPHFTLDLEQDFRRRVVGRFISGYAAGSTPNPCILCNGEVRIAAMLELAERAGADYLVTGHYARIVEDGDGPLLAAAADEAKDQSYMLAALPTELLSRLRFPLTELTKPQVREIAARHQLAVASKAESQDLCFLAGQGKTKFLRRHGDLHEREGAVLDRSGQAVGRHHGHHNFTVGQRRGIGVSAPEPLYVLATDAAANTVTVGTLDDLQTRRVRIRDAVLHRDGSRVDGVRLRYHSRALPAAIGVAGRGRHEALDIDLGEAFAGASPGQTAVLLSGEAVVGHGTIAASR
ncbi:MAG TPA: tRNA 2-thiouridine(34) synthase MnmA [Solirubrobacterales bacterium]|jgi:tRNA-specific 2-thiouridylase|nr:tRNA 2-thiouridine(34) synthase MnmA [Solirubrobacterales bacterium]